MAYESDDPISIEAAVDYILTAEPDVVFVADSIDSAYSLLSKLHELEERNFVILGPAYWDDPVAIRGYGQLLEGAIYATPFYRQSRRPIVNQFVTAYELSFNQAPDVLSAQGYDAISLAVKTLGEPSTSRIENLRRIRSIEGFAGVTGRLSVDRNGDIQRRMSVIRIEKGQLIEVMANGEARGVFLDKINQEEESEQIRTADTSN